MHTSRTKWVKADGVEFKKGAGVIFAMEEDQPQVGQISTIYVINGTTIIFRAILYSSSFLPHFRGYILHEHPHAHEKLMYLSDLILHTPVHIRRPQALPHSNFIILPHYIHHA